MRRRRAVGVAAASHRMGQHSMRRTTATARLCQRDKQRARDDGLHEAYAEVHTAAATPHEAGDVDQHRRDERDHVHAQGEHGADDASPARVFHSARHGGSRTAELHCIRPFAAVRGAVLYASMLCILGPTA